MGDTASGVASVAAAVGRTAYQWAGAGARMVRDGTVYCYQKSKSSVQSPAGISEDKTAQVCVLVGGMCQSRLTNF